MKSISVKRIAGINITLFILLAAILSFFLIRCGRTEELNLTKTPLHKFKNTHPRIYFNKEKLRDLRSKIDNSYRLIWRQIRAELDDRISIDPDPADFLTRQNPMRIYGETIPYFAVGYLMTGEKNYLDAAKKWLLLAAEFPEWGDEQDLGAAHVIYGMALCYDWLYNDLSLKEREIIRKRLVKQVNILADSKVWWKFKALQNHLWINTTAIATAGFALYGEVDRAKIWIKESHDKLLWVLNYLSPDGSSPEGMGYAQYGTEYLMKYFEAAKELLGKEEGDVFFQHPYFRNISKFFIYNFCPRNAWGNEWKKGSVQLNWGDAKRYPWYGPDYLLYKFAAETDDSYAQWFASEMSKSKTGHAVSSWLSLLWYNPDVMPLPPAKLPAFHHFDDINIAIMRRGWTGDESVLFFKCSPAMGHHFYTLADSLINISTSGNGHAHYDANSFMIFAEGEWLAIDPGYTNKKLTRNHNTILINGKGMINDGTPWGEFRTFYADDKPHLKSYGKKHISEIIRAESTSLYDYVIGDASDVYDEQARLTKYLRHVIYLKPDCYFIIDELEADTLSNFEWLLHAEDKINKVNKNSFVVVKNNAVLQVQSLLPNKLESKIYKQAVDGREITEMVTLSLSPQVKSEKLCFATLLHISKKGEVAWPEVEIVNDKNVYDCHIRIKDQNWDLRLDFSRPRSHDRIFNLRTDQKIKVFYSYVEGT